MLSVLLKNPYPPIMAGLILRLLHLKFAAVSPLLQTLIIDSQFYHRQALAIAQGNVIGDALYFMSPLYPYLLALIYALISPSPILIAFLQIALSGFTLYFLWQITLDYTGSPRAAGLAVWSGALFPVWIYFDSALLTASLILFLYTAALRFLLKFINREKSLFLALAGVCIGLSALARPSGLIFAAAVGVWTLFKYDIRKTAIFTIFTLAVILPFTVRNLAVTGEKVLITVSGGMNFYVGNSPDATGLYYEVDFLRSAEPQYELQDYILQAEKLSGRKFSPAETSSFWMRQGFAFILDHPWQTVKLYWRKFFYTFNNVEAPNNVSFYAVKKMSPLLKFLPWGFGFLCAGGVAGLLVMRKNPRFILILLLSGSVLMANLLFFTSSEFRFPLVTVLLIGWGIFLNRLWKWWKHRKMEWGILAVFLALLFFTGYQTDLSKSLKSPKTDYFNFGSVSLAEKNYPAAEKYFKTSLLYDPLYPPTHMALGTLYLDTGQYEKAAREFQAAGYSVTPEELKRDKVNYLP